MAKISIIGAGSVEFTRNILTDLVQLPGAARHAAARPARHRRGAPGVRRAQAAHQSSSGSAPATTVSAHADRREAVRRRRLPDQRDPGRRLHRNGHRLRDPARYGLRQTIADTIGIGGILRGLRTIPVMIAMGDEMAELCPDGLLLNYTNPMAMVPWGDLGGLAVARGAHDRRVPQRPRYPRVPGLARRRPRSAGRVPHRRLQPPVLRATSSGTARAATICTRACARSSTADPEGLGRRVRVEIFKRFGYFPTESSEHSSEYVPWFLHHHDQVERFRVRSTNTSAEATRTSRSGRRSRRSWTPAAEIEIEHNNELASQFVFALETGDADRAVRQRPQRRADRRAAGRRAASRCR